MMRRSNPVASTPGVSHSKSFRSRLGFGGSGGNPSNKSSFFSLKAGRRSFGGLSDLKSHDASIIVIDASRDKEKSSQVNHVMLNENSQARGTEANQKMEGNNNEIPYHLPRDIISHSLPPSPTRNSLQVTKVHSQSSRIKGAAPRIDPDLSGLSKHLPDLSADLSLLMNELPPDAMSQNGLQESKTSHSDLDGPTIPSNQEERKEIRTLGDTTASRRQMPLGGSLRRKIELSESSAATGDSSSASFDLSSAKMSLDHMRRSLGDDWMKSLVVEDNTVPGVEASDLLDPPSTSLVDGDSGPVTSTPFRSSRAFPPETQESDAEVSFNLDGLDPDLVALLHPNGHNQPSTQKNRVVTPSTLESFSPPLDPLNPDITVKRPIKPPTPSSSNTTRGQVSGPSRSPVRKYATLNASTSPLKPSQMPRSNTSQDFRQQFTNSFAIDSRPDSQLRQTNPRPDEQASSADPSSPSTTILQDTAKHTSPLSGTPLTLDDINRYPSPAESLTSSNLNNISTRRRSHTGATVQTHMSRPSLELTSSTDSRPLPRYLLRDRDRDREWRQTSASPVPSSPGPSNYASGSLGRERDRARPALDGVFPERLSSERRASLGRASSVSGPRPHTGPPIGPGMNGAFPRAAERRYRKRSMSLDESPAEAEHHRRSPEGSSRLGGVSHRFRPLIDRDRFIERAGSEGSDPMSSPNDIDPPFDGRLRDRERMGYGYGEYGGRPHMDWLGPKTVKAFAAAGLLDETRDSSGSRYFLGHARERERERWSPLGRATPMDLERDRNYYKYHHTANSRSGTDRDFSSSGTRVGVENPSLTRPPSRGEHPLHSRPGPLFARTMTDLGSQRGSVERDVPNMHYRVGSSYSPGGAGESTGSGGGRASPTTSSSLAAVQTQIQSLKEKHDAQTEALLAALADSQKAGRELKEENEALKRQIGTLEERLVEAIANSRQKEKEYARAMRSRPQSKERTRPSRALNQPTLHLPTGSKPVSPTKRRFSTSSSIFPSMPASMSLLMAETPGPPPQSSALESQPSSPTLVASQRTLAQQQERNDSVTAAASSVEESVSMTHKRSTSGASMATSANFSYETGSPGSLKLKPEHELLLGDMTTLSLVTGIGGDSERE